MYSRLWSFVLRLVDAVKKLVVIYQQALKLVLRLNFNLILLPTENKAFKEAVIQIMNEILSRKDGQWLLNGIREGIENSKDGEKSSKNFDDSCVESDTGCK